MQKIDMQNVLPQIVLGSALVLSTLAIGMLGVNVTYTEHVVGPPVPAPDGPDKPDDTRPMPPNPGPLPPTPPPDPGPVDGRFGIVRIAWEAAKQVDRPAECKALASQFRELAKFVRENNSGLLTIIGVPGGPGLLQTYVSKAIPPASRSAWQVFGEVTKGAIKAAYHAGKLSEPADWADCFDAIATGLETVK